MAPLRCLLCSALLLVLALPAHAQTPPIFQVAWSAPLVEPMTNAWKPRERGGVVVGVARLRELGQLGRALLGRERQERREKVEEPGEVGRQLFAEIGRHGYSFID